MADNLNSFNVLASAARDASVNSADFTKKGGRGLLVFFDISAISDDDTMQLTVEGKDPVGGDYYQLLQSAAFSTAGLRVYEIHPEAAAAGGGVTAVAARFVPETFRCTLTYALVGGVQGTLTCSVTVERLP